MDRRGRPSKWAPADSTRPTCHVALRCDRVVVAREARHVGSSDGGHNWPEVDTLPRAPSSLELIFSFQGRQDQPHLRRPEAMSTVLHKCYWGGAAPDPRATEPEPLSPRERLWGWIRAGERPVFGVTGRSAPQFAPLP